jgi:hypothetical protein
MRASSGAQLKNKPSLLIAYVYVHEIAIGEALDSVSTQSVAVEHKNTGQTPARYFNALVKSSIDANFNMKVAQRTGYTSKGLLESHLSIEEWLTHGAVLPPGITFTENSDLIGPNKANVGNIRDLVRSDKWWFVVSSITYRDVFGTLYAVQELFRYNLGTRKFERRDWDEAQKKDAYEYGISLKRRAASVMSLKLK